MLPVLLTIEILLTAAALAIGLLFLKRQQPIDWTRLQPHFDSLQKGSERIEHAVRDEIARNREEGATQSRALRDEMAASLKLFNDSLLKQLGEMAQAQKSQLELFSGHLNALREANDRRLDSLRAAVDQQLAQMVQTSQASLGSFREETSKSINGLADSQRATIEAFAAQLTRLTETTERKLDEVRAAVEGRLAALQTDNAAKLDEMRKVVDEKLQGTLERRLGESFKLVSDRLELVHKGLGEMQNLAIGVGDLKKVLTNVKARGTWGEIQLASLLEQVLSREQYAANVCTKPGSNERVEFALKLPGRDDANTTVWLPIDAKFPKEDYDRLVIASEQGDAAGVEEAAKQLENRIRLEARNIRDRYLSPPHTTDFGILFLPTEGLYAEALRRPGLVESLQREHRVSVAGPTTLAALLNSLQMGFRTLAIQKRSSEVWQVLGAVKTEFGRFGEVIGKVQKKPQEASNAIDTAATKSRTIERKLRDVEALPSDDAVTLLADADAATETDSLGSTDLLRAIEPSKTTGSSKLDL